MQRRDFLFWLVSMEHISPKRRWMFWELGQNIPEQELILLTHQLMTRYGLSPVDSMLNQQLMKLPHICIDEESYPECLRQIAQPPLVLFYRGDKNLLKYSNLAIVGSRHQTTYSQQLIDAWVPEIVAQGYVIISGAARGVDGHAHKVTLSQNGKTIAVLGHGLNHVYPAEHQTIYDQISRNGLLLTEYLPWTGPERWHFPARNRIIVGLTRNIWIVEASENSGSLVSAQIAIDENRQIWCVPGDVTRQQSRGSNQLLSDGANMILSANDLIIGLRDG